MNDNDDAYDAVEGDGPDDGTNNDNINAGDPNGSGDEGRFSGTLTTHHPQ